MYSSQVLTSLPDEPIFSGLLRLYEIDRDSIIAVFYDLPEDFPYTFDQILKEPIATFKELDFQTLKTAEDSDTVYYKRITPLKFIGHSGWIDDEKNFPKQEGGYNRDVYSVTPSEYLFGTEVYDENRTLVRRIMSEKLMRYRMLSNLYLGK